jgi:outer membrane lipoprotein-sorting protein
MTCLRTLPTSRLLALLGLVLALCVASAAGAVVASGGDGPTPPPKPLAEALHDSLAGPPVDGVTARVTFTNKLFPSGALTGSAGPVLMSGGSGRLWLASDGHGRIELQSNLGDAQIVWSPTAATVYDASSNTVYKATLPQAGSSDAGPKDTPPTLAEITDLLTRVGVHVALSEATPSNVGGMPAYTVALSPKHDGGLLGAVEVSWDATHAVPLRVAIYAQGSSSPVLELSTSDISYGAVDASSVDVAPPANAKVVDLGQLDPAKGGDAAGGGETPVTGLAAVQAAVDFPVSAPATLVGLPRQDVRLVGDAESQTVVVSYGQGLGGIVVAERKAPVASGGDTAGPLDSLPTLSLDGVTAHELATQLGTIVTWQHAGISTILAGSVPAAAAEAAARDLR